MEDKCCCSCRTTERDDDSRKSLMNRLKRLEGQIRGLEAMVEEDRYCVDILTQASAASAALNSFSREVLSAHIHGCVEDDIRAGKEETVDELMKILEKMMR